MTDPNEHDGPTLAEIAGRNDYELPKLSRHTCRICGHDAATDPTPGELRVLVAYIETGNQKLAGVRLGVSTQTIKNVLSNLYRRIGVDGGVQAAYRFGRGDFTPHGGVSA